MFDSHYLDDQRSEAVNFEYMITSGPRQRVHDICARLCIKNFVNAHRQNWQSFSIMATCAFSGIVFGNKSVTYEADFKYLQYFLSILLEFLIKSGIPFRKVGEKRPQSQYRSTVRPVLAGAELRVR